MYIYHKYRLYPTVKQMQYLDRNFGAARFVWNQFVANFNNYGTEQYNAKLSEVDIKKEHPWLKECISYAIQQKKMDFWEFTRQYFNKKRKNKLGRPKFKKKGVSKDSFKIPGQQIGFNSCIKDGRLKLTKMTPIKIILDRPINGLIQSVTISKNKCNEYYASLLLKVDEPIHKEKTNEDIGLDLGLSHLAILSNGTKFENPNYFRETQSKLAKAQRHFSRKIKGSKRREQQRLKVAKLYQKITRQREWYYHQISNYLVNTFDTICIENLNVKGMIKNKNLSKSIADVSWSSLISMIDYKSKWSGKELIKISRFYPSSKTCSCCGFRLYKLDLGARSWACPSCNIEHDRDINAAINIYKEGMLKKHGLFSEELPEYRHGEDVRPIDFLKGFQKANFNEVSSKVIDQIIYEAA